MEQIKNYITMPTDLPNCIIELSGDKLTVNGSFWDKFCTSHSTVTNNYVLRTIFRKMLGITYVKNNSNILDNYVWDNKRNGYYSTVLLTPKYYY